MTKHGELFEVFLETARRCRRRPALTFLDARLQPRSYTYEALFDRADELGPALAKRVDSQAPLGILVRSQEAQVLHYLAALSQGLVPAILTPPNRKLNREYYVQTMNAVLDRCVFSAVVTDVESLEIGVPALAPLTFEGLNEPAATVRPRPPFSPDGRRDASFLQFSSGTTGIKRGVLVTDEAVLAQLDVYSQALALDARDVILSWLPLYHDMGFVACLNMPLASGVHAVMLDPVDWVTNPSLFLRAASAYRATVAWNPNFAYAFMAQRVRDGELDRLDLSSFRGLANCSEPVTFESQQQFLERFRPLGLRGDVFWGCYAMAETTFALTHGTPGDPHYLDERGPEDSTVLRGEYHVSVGSPLPGVDLKIVGEGGEELGERQVGEIFARSPFTFSGYYNDEEATAEAFADGWYRTGDLGYRVEDAFYVVGRKKDLIIVSGVNVFPNDIEELVSSVEGVVPGRVSAFSNFDRSMQTERVVILFEPGPDGARSPQATSLDIRQRVLASFQIANFEVHPVPPGWLVKSSSGKMARSANRRKWAEEKDRERATTRRVRAGEE